MLFRSATSGGFVASYVCNTGTATLPLELPPGSFCNVTLSKVSSNLAAVGTFSVTYAKGSSSAVPLAMPKVPGPAILTPSSLSLSLLGGDGVSPQYATISVLNAGEQSATISAVQTMGDPFTVVENCTHNSLDYGATCNISISSVGGLSAKSANVVVNYNGSKSLIIPVSQSIANNDELGNLNLSDTQLNFGANVPGQTSSKSFTVTNTSDWRTTVKSLSIAPANDYTYVSSCKGSSSLPAVLAKNEIGRAHV